MPPERLKSLSSSLSATHFILLNYLYVCTYTHCTSRGCEQSMCAYKYTFWTFVEHERDAFRWREMWKCMLDSSSSLPRKIDASLLVTQDCMYVNSQNIRKAYIEYILRWHLFIKHNPGQSKLGSGWEELEILRKVNEILVTSTRWVHTNFDTNSSVINPAWLVTLSSGIELTTSATQLLVLIY